MATRADGRTRPPRAPHGTPARGVPRATSWPRGRVTNVFRRRDVVFEDVVPFAVRPRVAPQEALACLLRRTERPRGMAAAEERTAEAGSAGLSERPLGLSCMVSVNGDKPPAIVVVAAPHLHDDAIGVALAGTPLHQARVAGCRPDTPTSPRPWARLRPTREAPRQNHGARDGERSGSSDLPRTHRPFPP